LGQIVTARDKDSNLPLELINLSSQNPRAFAITNSQGQADIAVFRGSAGIEFRLMGYATKILSYDDIAKNNFSVQLSASPLAMEQVVVSATRWYQSQREIPAKITTISSQETEIQNPQTAADLLGSSGEIFIQKSQQGGGSPMIRGFATNRLLINVDGIRMNTAIFRSGNLQNVISLDPFSMVRTEVLYGPGSVIYGSDAVAGVMSFYTHTPQFSLSDKPLLRGSTVGRFSSANNELTGHFDLNAGWNRWAFVSSFSQSRFNDLRMGSNGPDEYLRRQYIQRIDSVDRVVFNDDPEVQRPTGYSQISMLQKIRYQPNFCWDITYGLHYSATTDYSRYDRLLRYKNGLPRSAEWYYGPQKWMMHNLNFTHNADIGLYDQFTARFAYQFFEESRIDRDFNDTELRSRVEKVDAYSVNFDFARSISGRHNLYFGLEAVYDDVASQGTNEDISTGAIQTGPARYPESDWGSYAAYLTYQYKATDKLVIQAGARYNQYVLDARFDTTFYPFPFTSVKINDGALTGNIGLIYNPTDVWSLNASIATGFRSPNVDDLGKVFDSEPGSVVVPNPDLSAEKVYNGEIGITRIFDDVVKLNATGFYTWLDDAMVRRDFILNGMDSIMYDGEMSRVQAMQNAAYAEVWGIQGGLEAKLPAGFYFLSRITYQKGKEELDDGSTNPLRHAAPVTGLLKLTYTAPQLKFEFYSVHCGEVSYDDLPEEERGKDYMYAVDGNGNPYSPGWYTLNFKTLYHITENLSVSGGVENLTNKRYRPYSSGLLAPGRNFIMSLRAGI
jgi:hemoglobin/transferrin/lactoferrin receptor protein